MKKNNKKSFPKGTNFSRKHDPLIAAGESKSLQGWLNAGAECVDKFRGNATAYAKASVNGFVVSQTEATIRQYVSAVVVGIKQYGSRSALMTAFGKAHAKGEVRSLGIVSLRSFVAGSGKRGKGDAKSSKQDTVAITKRKATSFINKFVPANKREEAMEALGF